MLPMKKLSAALSRPTTAGLVPEEKVDAIEAEARAKIAREAREKEEEEAKMRGSAPGADVEVTGRALWTEANSDLGPDDLEKAFYVCRIYVLRL